MKPEPLMTRKELAAYLHVSPSTLDNRVKAGLIHAYPIPCIWGCDGPRCEHVRPVRFCRENVDAELRRRAMMPVSGPDRGDAEKESAPLVRPQSFAGTSPVGVVQ